MQYEYKGHDILVSGKTAAGAKQTDTTVSIYRDKAVNSAALHEHTLLGASSDDQGYAYARFWIDAQLAQRT